MNMFGNLGKMAEMVKQAKALSEELKRSRYEGESGGAKAVVNGEMEVLELQLPLNADRQKGSQLAKEAVNRALRLAKSEATKVMSKMTGGLGLPGM